jgi:hypothetical protein
MTRRWNFPKKLGKDKLEILYSNVRDLLMLRNGSVWIDGSPVGTIATGRDIAKGCEFRLTDGSLLRIQFTTDWVISLNGQPLWDELENPLKGLHDACYALWFFAGAEALLGASSGFWYGAAYLGFGYRSVITGISYSLLTILVWRQSFIALMIIAISVIAEIVAVCFDQAFNQYIIFLWYSVAYLMAMLLASMYMRFLKSLKA